MSEIDLFEETGNWGIFGGGGGGSRLGATAILVLKAKNSGFTYHR